MEPMIRLVVEGDVQKWSPNQRGHWRVRHARTINAHTRVWFAWRKAGSPKSLVPVRVNVTIYRGRALDADNAVGSLKNLWDRAFCGNRFPDGAITPDDGPKWVSLGDVRQITGKEWKGREKVVLEVWPREEE